MMNVQIMEEYSSSLQRMVSLQDWKDTPASIQRLLRELNSEVEKQQASLDHQSCFCQQLELALETSEHRIKALAGNLPGVIYRFQMNVDGSYTFTHMSEGIENLYGLDLKEVEADASVMWRVVHPDDLQRLQDSILESARNLKPWFMEYRVTTLSGDLKWIQCSSKPEQRVDGTIVWNGILMDISDRIQTELALKQSQERYASLTKAVPVGIFRTDAHGKCLYVNDRWSEITGLDTSLTVGMNWVSAIHLHDREYVSTEWYRAIDEQSSLKLEYRLQHTGDEIIWVYGQIVAEYSDTGEVISYVGTITDITDRKRVETAIQTSEERYRMLAENTNDLICLLNRYGRYIYVSPSSKPLLGYAFQDLIGENFFEFIHPQDCDRFRQELALLNSTQVQKPITYRMRRKNGDYVWLETLAKPIFDSLGQVLRLQTTSRNVTDRIQVQEQLKHDTLHDDLTDLPNRNLLMERLELAIQRAKRREDCRFAVLFLDLDRFKIINDSLGHLAGDRLLILVAQKFQSVLRATDVAARLGGDEFVILLEEIKNIQQAIHVVERIFAEFKSPFNLFGREVFISTSIGIVWSNQEYTQPSDLLRDADIAMYRAKSQGSGRYQIFDNEMHADALIRLDLENDLRQGLDREEFVVYYQPIFSLKTSSLVGFEALVRWQHPTKGLIYPGDFIEVAEETGLILALDRWVLQVACQQLVQWQKAFPHASSLKVSVNLSAQDLWSESLIQDTINILKETGLMGNQLILEITESMLISDMDLAASLLKQLKNEGIQISIDDFGTGFASLSYLHRLPVDNLKIDRSFVNKIQENKRNYKIIETIISLSNQLDIQTVAEGIETQQQLHSLQEIGCDYAQGYLLSRPLSVDFATSLLSTTRL